MIENVIIDPGFFTLIQESYKNNKIIKNSIICDDNIKEIKNIIKNITLIIRNHGNWN